MSSASNQGLPTIDPVHRPAYQLRSLPLNLRWEVTRRHPYYIGWWQWARDHWRGARRRYEGTEGEAEQLLRLAAVTILAAIGFCGDPPDPTAEFESLDSSSLNAGWLSGAVHPMTVRAMAAVMLTTLPDEELGRVGLAFMQAAYNHDDGDSRISRVRAVLELDSMNLPALDTFPDEPYVSINPAASIRDVQAALADLLPQWRQERGIDGQRNRTDLYPGYLEVWDLREGWKDGAYNRESEMTFQEITRELNLPIPTVANRYERAFELIVGHSYSPELWVRVLGPVKLSELWGETPGPVSARRPIQSRTSRPVPDSVLHSTHLGLVTPVQASADESAAIDRDNQELLADIFKLLADGKSDEQICDELGLSDEALRAIAHLRQRGDEFRHS